MAVDSRDGIRAPLYIPSAFLVLTASGVVATYATVDVAGILPGWTAFPILAGILTVTLRLFRPISRNHKLLATLIIIFALRVTGGYLYHYVIWQPAYDASYEMALEVTTDAVRYDRIARLLVDSEFDFPGGIRTYLEQPAFAYFIALVYRVFGPSPFIVLQILSVLALMAGVQVYRLGSEITSDRIGRLTMMLFLVTPDALLWNWQMVKEIPVVLCILIATVAAMRMATSRRSPRSWARLLVSLFGLFLLRLGAFLAMEFGIIVCWLAHKRRLAAIVLAGLSMLFIWGAESSVVNSLQDTVIAIARGEILSRHITRPQHTGLSLFSTTEEESLTVRFSGEGSIGWLASAPLRMTFLLLAPFPPWNQVEPPFLLHMLNVWFTIALGPFFLVGVFRSASKAMKGRLFIFAIPLILMLAMALGGQGIVSRHRLMVMPFYLLLAAIGLVDLRANRRLLPVTFSAYALVFILTVIVYYALKGDL